MDFFFLFLPRQTKYANFPLALEPERFVVEKNPIK